MRQNLARSRCLFGWLLASTLLWTGAASPTAANDPRRTPVVKAVEEARPSVVSIHGRKTVRSDETQAGPGDNFRQVNGMGTGIVVDERGYILTNYHVVEGVSRIQVTLNSGRTATARLIAHDLKTDLAIIKLNEADETLPVIRIGTSSDLMAGEPVIAVGNAFGYENTVTEGIISALHRTVQVSDEQTYRDVIQISASINPGNSGGPLLNINGDLIGINVAVRIGAQGIAFAIPVDQALETAATLMSHERSSNVAHGLAGTTQLLDTKPRFVVGTVRKASPADASGLLAGDIVTAVGDRRIQRSLDFERALLGHKSGDELDVQVRRKDETMRLKLALGGSGGSPQRAPTNADRTWEMLGLKLETAPQQVIRQVNDHYNGGLKVLAVRPDGPAAQQGIRRGDILVGMHKWETVSMENVAFILNSDEFAKAQPAKFYILRGSETLYGHLRVSVVSDR